MATAAFKSKSRWSNNGYVAGDALKTNPHHPNPPPQKQKLRRSLSVNALSRYSQIDTSSEFLNKRDNPLFWTTDSSSAYNNNDTETPPPIAVSGGSLLESGVSKTSNSNVVVGERGRSVRRNSNLRNGSQKDEVFGRQRSLSRVKYNGGNNGGGRWDRSVSRAKLPSGASQVDSQISNWDDGISVSSLSEAEEKTIRAVYEQMKSFAGENSRKDIASSEIFETVRSEVRRAIADIQDDLQNAIRRNSAGALVSTDVTNVSPNLVKPKPDELVLDIRREYAKELEESQERARKLRSDLAFEEHRKLELSRILMETLPEPKASSSVCHRSRLGRKSSSERKKMSKRLTDEAMLYFDECVSISTFDSSDFSAAEEPAVHSVDANLTTCATTSITEDAQYITASGTNDCINRQVIHGSCSTADSSSNELITDRMAETIFTDRKSCFSFGHKSIESVELQHNIQNYIKTFEKDMRIDGIASEQSRVDLYDLHDINESLLFDKVFFRNRHESRSLHICGGVVSFFPFTRLI